MLSSPQLLPHSQLQNEATTELLFVHESGHPDLDDEDEESNDEDEDEDEGGWGHVEFSGSDAGQCSSSQGCAIPIDRDQLSFEKVSLHLDVL